MKVKPKKKKEFSKVILSLVMFAFFAAAILGGVIVWRDTGQLAPFLSFIGVPTATAIGFYAWKAKNENVEKIGAQPPKSKEDDYIEDGFEI